MTTTNNTQDTTQEKKLYYLVLNIKELKEMINRIKKDIRNDKQQIKRGISTGVFYYEEVLYFKGQLKEVLK